MLRMSDHMMHMLMSRHIVVNAPIVIWDIDRALRPEASAAACATCVS